MKEREIIFVARALSIIFNPFYLPLVGLLALFTFSYLSLLPWMYKAVVLLMVYVFTVFLPTLFIRMYHRYEGWALFELYTKERRMIPYVISIACYFVCYYVMRVMHIPHFMGCIVVAALMIQIACAVVNLWWKISNYTAAIGGMGGAMLAFSEIFGYNPVWWLCGILLLAGMIGSSRLIMRQQSLSQVVGGFAVGLVAAFLTVMYMP